MYNYSLFSRKTGEWLGAVHGMDSAADAIDEWCDSFESATGYTPTMVRAERLPDDYKVAKGL